MAVISKQALQVANNTDFPDNNSGAITPSDLRSFNTNMIDSTVNQIVYTGDSGSWNISITNLNAFTASQQPVFNSLNDFTASQLSINNGYNAATYSLNDSINTLNDEVNSLQAWTSSVNEIRFNSGVPQYATRWNFGGFISASFVSNVGGLIADITVLNDPSKLNTSSFNAYTASTAATQSVFSASVVTSITNLSSSLNAFTQSQTSWNNAATASITQLLDFSSSLDATYATDAQLNASSSVLQANIDTKLNSSAFNAYTQSTNTTIAGLATTSSFNEFSSSQGSSTILLNQFSASTNLFTASINTYTASNDTKWNAIGLLTGSYATTGSNAFTGSQTITGSVLGNIVPLTITSQTASMDLSTGNFFTLTLVSGSTTRLVTSNVRAGQTVNLLITQASFGTGSLSYDSTLKFPAGNNYVASPISSSKDIITFIAFDNSTIYAAAINNLI
jgi:hypothetical protein